MDPSSSTDHRSAVMAGMVAAGALVAQQVAGRATRDTLFLSTFSVSSLPLVMIAAAVVSAAAVLAFSGALSRRAPAQVVPVMLAAATVLLLAEWGLSVGFPRLAAVAVYLHMAAFGATVVSGFWSVINERFDPHTARRVMGDITLGASLGGVAGGLLAWAAAGLVPVASMLAVMAAFNVVCLVALRRLGGPTRQGDRRLAPAGEGTGPLSGLRVMQEVPYLRHLALIVALGAATEALLDYLLNTTAVARFTGGPPLMSFFALFHTGVGWLALAVQMTLARAALGRLGLAGTVALRPAAVAAGALLGLVHPSLWSAVAARGAHGVLHNSLFRSGYELLFTPVTERRKRPTKAIVDVGFDKVGTVAGGLLVLLVSWLAGGHDTRVLFGLALAGSLGALAVSRQLSRGYVTALEDSLRSGAVRLDLADVVDSTTSMTLSRTGFSADRQEILRDIMALRGERRGETPAPAGDPVAETVADLRSGDPERQRRGLRRPEVGDPALVGHLIPLIAGNAVFLDVLRVLRRSAAQATGQLLDALLDPRQPAAVRRRIPRVLRRTATQRAADGLILGLLDPEFGVRRQCALTLAHLVEREPSLVIPRAVVFAAVVRDLEAGTGSWTEDHEAAVLENGTDGAGSRTPVERGLSHVFALLSLVVEREPLQIAYWAVRGDDPALRGTALEYLENVLPDDVRRVLWPFIGTRPKPSAPSRTRQHLVDDLMRSSENLGLSQAMKRIPRR